MRAGLLCLVVGCLVGCGSPRGAVPDDAGRDAASSLEDAPSDVGVSPVESCEGGIEIVAPLWTATASTPVSVESFCTALLAAVCEPLATCGCDAAILDACGGRMAEVCEGEGSGFSGALLGSDVQAALASGQLVYDPARAGALIEVVRAAGSRCEVGRWNLPSSLVHWASNLEVIAPAGGAEPTACSVTNPFTCPRRQACVFVADFSYGCVGDPTADCGAIGVCQHQGTLSSRVECSGTECDEGLPPGEGPCFSGRWCRHGSGPDGVCVDRAPVGGSCFHPTGCVDGAFCAFLDPGTSVCRAATARLGEPCGEDVGCVEGTCSITSGRCVPVACVGW